MASLDDLKNKSISEMTPDEAIEYMRLIRLSRRTPIKTTKQKSSSTKKAKAKAIPKLDSNQAANLLKLLEGE